jgi:hypothetical protein
LFNNFQNAPIFAATIPIAIAAQIIRTHNFGILIGSLEIAGEITNPVNTPVITIRPARNFLSEVEITVEYYFLVSNLEAFQGISVGQSQKPGSPFEGPGFCSA